MLLFASEFYQTLRKEIHSYGAKPFGLDLSNSLIQGDFIGSNLGLRTTIYPQAISLTFTPSEQEQLQQLREVCLKSLAIGLPSASYCRSLLRQEPNISTVESVFRSALIMQQTRFNGAVQFANTFFLQPVDASGAVFNQSVNFTEARFSRTVSFANASFRKDIQLINSIFFDKVDLKQAQFRNQSELLELPEIDFETYIKTRDQIIVDEPLLFGEWLLIAWSWLFIAVLLLLSGYGTQVWLVFGVGAIAIAYFGLLYWLIDKYRRLRPVPIVPTCYETSWILTSYCIFTSIGLLAIFSNAEQPWFTLGCLVLIILPIPLILLARLYQIGRFHNKMDVSYFTEDGTLRQLRLLIGRLPVIPRNPT